MSYLLRPSLQLLPLLQADLPYSSQKIMRGHEDPRTQEKREDVRPLKEGGVNDDQTAATGVPSCTWPGFYQVITLGLCLHGLFYLKRLCFFYCYVCTPRRHRSAGILQYPLFHPMMGVLRAWSKPD